MEEGEKVDELYFGTLDSNVLCRMGRNGPFHGSQFVGLSLVRKGESLLDVGCGSATTLECLRKHHGHLGVKYKGVDMIEKHIEWCKENFPGEEFEVQDALSLKEPDDSWDVVFSRHVVDHLASFEEAIDEQLRVARKRVICIMWYEPTDDKEHQIKPIKMGNKIYKDYLNFYSKEKVFKYLESKKPEWDYKYQRLVGHTFGEGDFVFYLEKL